MLKGNTRKSRKRLAKVMLVMAMAMVAALALSVPAFAAAPDGDDLAPEGGNSVASAKSAKPISSCKLSEVYNKVYTGSALTPKLTVTHGSTTLVEGVDYELSYKDNTKCGEAIVIVKGINDYEGTETTTFYIIPAKMSRLKLKAKGGGKVAVKWSNKVPVAAGVTGYQIWYKVKGKSAKKVLVKKASAASKTIKKLKKGKRVKVKIRAYKTVFGHQFFGAWSTARSVKVR